MSNDTLNEIFALSRRYLETGALPYQRTFYKEHCFKDRLSILVGQRGVGKSTLIMQHLLDQVSGNLLSNKILYVPVDHFAVSTLALYEIAKQFEQFAGETIVFDEIHKYNNWSQELKSIYETFPSLQIIASGSSALKIHQGSHDLARRAILYQMAGLSLREYLELKLNLSLSSYSLTDLLERHEQISYHIVQLLKEHNKKILPIFNAYLRHGYYPYFLEVADENSFFVTLEQSMHATIESDLTAIYPALSGSSSRKIRQLLSFVASAVPFTPQWKRIKNIIEVGDERTLKTYFKYLEDAKLIRMLMRYSNKMQQLDAPEKIYLNNTNQLYAITSEVNNIGTVRETFFMSMLAVLHKINIPQHGDFIIDDKFTFEIGGKNKDRAQIKQLEDAYLVCDNIETSLGKKIPLWLFGFLY